MNSGYEQIYEGLIPKLRECNLSDAAQRLGLPLRPDGSISVSFLGRDYIISSHGVNPADGKTVDVNNRSVLAYYILSKGIGEPAFSYVPFSHLANTGIAFNSNISWMTDPLGERFSGDYSTFSETMTKLGGIFSGNLKSSGYSWILKILPKIPLNILYYEKDDEFPCEVKIMFDKHASRFMEFECLAFLKGCLVRAIIMTAQTGNTSGWI